jgi:tRNA(Ile)-lysidine synthase
MLSEALNSRLQQFAGEGNEPLAVAFSGGGDSTALLHLLIKALEGQGRDVHALIVDHKLRRGSGVEAKLSADRARAMGAQPTILKWIHDNPTTGIQEKARIARYGLMGEACRRLGVQKLFLGHNLGDQAETVLMRQRKASGWRGLAGMQARVKAPIWPQLRNIDVLRPLLGETREALRAYNEKSGLEYIDDPSNDHLGFERIRTRQELQDSPDLTDSMLVLAAQSQSKLIEQNKTISSFVDEHVEFLDWGGIWVKASGLLQHKDETIAALRLLIPCISGNGSFPPADRLHQHIRSLKAGFTAGTTLGGARLVSREKGLSIVRDAGMVLGRHQLPPLRPVNLPPNQPMIWDGRFIVETSMPDMEVLALGQIEGRPDKETKKALKAIPLAARKTIPVFCSGHEIVNIPFIQPDQKFTATSLVSERLDGFLRLGKA